MPRIYRCKSIFIGIVVASIVLAGCNIAGPAPAPTSSPAESTPAVSQAPTSLSSSPTAYQPTATPTPVPLAATVNGEGILLSEYQADLASYQASQGQAGTNLASPGEKQVLDDLIDQTLLAQGAAKDGFVVDDSAVQARFDQLSSQVGGSAALSAWMSKYGYQESDFRRSLARSVAAAHMRDRIAASVPTTTEQVHALQILLFDETQANQILSQIQSGSDFAKLAAKYDPVTQGDLGWFPRGYLTDPALEEAAFSLQPGEHSGVIHTNLGYQIIQVVERDPQRLLSVDARQALQAKALHDWLAEQRKQSQIQISIP